MRPSLALAATAALLAGFVGAASPALAACTVGDTTCSGVQFTVTGGVLAIAAAPTATATSSVTSAAGGTLSIDIATTVTDGRSPTTGWSIGATASDFAGDTAGVSIPKSAASFSVPSAPTPAVACSFTRPASVGVNATTGTTTAPILTCAALITNSATYVARLTVTIPAGSTAGVYTGTVTQSAS